MNDRYFMLMYPHLVFEENRRELEREQELRRQTRDAHLSVRQRAKSSRTSPLSRLRQAFRRNREAPVRSRCNRSTTRHSVSTAEVTEMQA